MYDTIYSGFCMNGHCYEATTLDELIVSQIESLEEGEDVVIRCPFTNIPIEPKSVEAFMSRPTRTAELLERRRRELQELVPDMVDDSDYEESEAPPPVARARRPRARNVRFNIDNNTRRRLDL